MNKELAGQNISGLLIKYAKQYNVESFIDNDPIQFPHRYTDVRDIEISAFISAWISFGNRKNIVSKGNEIDLLFHESPSAFILDRKYTGFRDNHQKMYRILSWDDFYQLCDALYTCYSTAPDMEAYLQTSGADHPLTALCSCFGHIRHIPDITSSSSCKRLCMFLRWMVRNDGIVDFGLWQNYSAADLIIPLDVHVYQQACRLGFTQRKDKMSMKTAKEITDVLKQYFPNDPLLGDFALFGYGINHK